MDNKTSNAGKVNNRPEREFRVSEEIISVSEPSFGQKVKNFAMSPLGIVTGVAVAVSAYFGVKYLLNRGKKSECAAEEDDENE